MNAWGSYGIYAAFAVGAAAIYFLLPRAGSRRAMSTAGWIAAVLAGLTAVFASKSLGPHGADVLVILFAALAVLAALRVITHPKPVYSAVYFVAVILAVAAILVLQEAEFLAIALIVIYAGAILVTYLFVIMLAQQPGSPVYDRRAREPFWAVVAGLVLTGAVAGQTFPSARPDTYRGAASAVAEKHTNAKDRDRLQSGNTAAVGVVLFTKYIVVLELSGVLLLISMVGAIALSRKRVLSEVAREGHGILGEIGKGVAPF